MRALLLFLTALAAGTSSPQDPIRTADISLRGLTKADFPRTTKLAENVYAYEQIDPTKRTVTVNNLIVITSEGVLIAESQGTVDNVTRLVADVAKLTPQPIKYVVVGSEHGDHTGGIAAFPAGVTYLAHPFSAPRIKQPTEPVTRQAGSDRLAAPRSTSCFSGGRTPAATSRSTCRARRSCS